MSIADIALFYAIMPQWLNLFEKHTEFRKQLPLMTKWTERMLENEDLVRFLNEVPQSENKAKM